MNINLKTAVTAVAGVAIVVATAKQSLDTHKEEKLKRANIKKNMILDTRAIEEAAHAYLYGDLQASHSRPDLLVQGVIFMQVEVTESNIDKFDLVNRFGNSREFLLNEAANAAAKGMVLSVELPDDVVLEQNVFEVFEGEHVDPRRLRGCGYEKKQDVDGVEHWVCVLHGKTSRYDVSADSHVPCIQVDPEVRPSEAEFNDALSKMDKTCVYNKIDDPNEGTVYICAVHGKTSKHDITRLPNLPCKAVDPEHL